jgi:hypothetical protein
MASIVTECTPVVDPERSVALCRRPYPKYPHGCPNWGRCPTTPLRRLVRLRGCWLAVGEYDLEAHAERARRAHPDWSERALRNPRHWQQGARARLRAAIDEWLTEHPAYVVIYGPESHGLDVTETCRRAGVDLEWPTRWEDTKVVRQVALLGVAV